ELNQSHRRGIAPARLELQNARVPTGRIDKPGSHDLEQLRRRKGMIKLAHDQPAIRVSILPADRDELLNDWADGLRLRLCRCDPLVQDHRDGHLAEQRPSLRWIAAEFSA